MNNLLPLVLIMFAATRGNGGGISPETLAPLLSALGSDNNVVSALSESGLFSGSGKESFSAEKLLPLAISLLGKGSVGSDFKKTDRSTENFTEKTSAEDFSSAPNYLKPITDIAGDEINYALSHYFANN